MRKSSLRPRAAATRMRSRELRAPWDAPATPATRATPTSSSDSGLSSRPLRLAAILALALATGSAPGQDAVKRGEYIAQVAGCAGCHTEAREAAVRFAGGREIVTPFGKFFGPNLTPHPVAGLGSWTEGDFLRAMRLGERPDGAHYYPAFPYTSFTAMTDA